MYNKTKAPKSDAEKTKVNRDFVVKKGSEALGVFRRQCTRIALRFIPANFRIYSLKTGARMCYHKGRKVRFLGYRYLTMEGRIMKKTIALLTALIFMLTMACAQAEEIPMRLTSVQWDGSVVGKCFAPQDFQVGSDVSVCTAAQSLANPLLLNINAVSADGNILMAYASTRDYIQILESTMGGATMKTHVDGQIDTTSLTPMLQFMYASGYCDYIATSTINGVQLVIDSENSYPELQDTFMQAAQKLYDETTSMTAGLGMQVEDAVVDACERRYSFEYEGTPYYLTVAAGITGMQILMEMQGVYGGYTDRSITWGAPYTYIFLCPQAQYDQYYPCFSLFADNTGANDQFRNSNTRLSTEIRESVLASRSLDGAASYSRSVLSDEAARGDDYYEDRYTDYIFDNNEYTLSDGSSVKVSTAYDYVYEDSNGNVIVTDSAFVEPAGSTRLTAKH